MTKIQILLIEDNRLLREGITAILNDQGEFEVTALSGEIDAKRQLVGIDAPPHVVLMDLGLERTQNLSLMAIIRQQYATAKIIAMDILPDHADIVEFVKAGGSGFILKDAPLSDYIATIKAVAGGEQVLPPLLTNSLFTQIIEYTYNKGEAIPADVTQLTFREREVVELISEGFSNKDIAGRLYISTFTVKSHVHNILEKLTLNSRLEIAAFVRREDSSS
jgi:DNA-binding NarL/FixJ family response regulator